MSHKFLRWSVWWLLLALLTYGLVSPQPPKVSAALLPPGLTFGASKATHLFAYALLSGLVPWLPASSRQRLGLWLLLATHGALTEFIQLYVPGREGSLRDVGINLAGLCLGLALAQLVSRRRPQAPTERPS
jgi:VanZ family protein